MFSSVWNFVKRNKKKFIFTGIVAGGIVLVGKYVRKKVEEMQENETTVFIERAKRQHYFESNQRTCNMTVLSMMPTLRTRLMKALDSESLIVELQNQPENKLAIWEELKSICFTRTISAIYCCSLLVVFLRLQLNIIGGCMYLDRAQGRRAQFRERGAMATVGVQQKYLAKVEYLFGAGLQKLIADVRRATDQVIGGMSLKEQISLQVLQEIISSIRHQLEHREIDSQEGGGGVAVNSKLGGYLLPTGEDDDSCQQSGSQACALTSEEIKLNELVQDTWDMVESSDFHCVVTTCLDGAFFHLLDKMADYCKPDMTGFAAGSSDLSLPLAKVIPIINGLVHVICSEAPNPFVHELLVKEQVQDFAANVYEAFILPRGTADEDLQRRP